MNCHGRQMSDLDHEQILQRFECVVDEVDKEVAYCTLYDLTDTSNPIEFAEIFLSAFHKEPREGDVFHWIIFQKLSSKIEFKFEFIEPTPLTDEQQQKISEKAKNTIFGNDDKQG